MSGRCAIGLGAGLGLVAAAAAVAAQERPRGPVLAQLQPGLWELRPGEGRRVPIRSLCLADPDMLFQLQHGSARCTRLVIDSGPEGANVRYDCANGFGRTRIRVETARLARVESQGIIDGAPFAFRAEARRVGACASARRGSEKSLGRTNR